MQFRFVSPRFYGDKSKTDATCGNLHSQQIVQCHVGHIFRFGEKM